MSNLGFSSRDLQFMTEPSGTGPTTEWEQAKEMRDEAEFRLRYTPRRSSLELMTPRARKRWERYIYRMNCIMDHYEDIVQAGRCPGCGEYSEGGKVHNYPSCKSEVRYGG
jgi:hypothetical protein